MKVWACVLGLALATACSPKPEEQGAIVPVRKEADAPPYVPGTPITVTVTLSDSAHKKVAGVGEKITVDATYYGQPKPGVDAEEMGVMLGEERVDLEPDSPSTTLAGGYDTQKLAKDVDGEARLLINIYTARKALPDNLLSCDIFDDTVRKAAALSVGLACKLIEE